MKDLSCSLLLYPQVYTECFIEKIDLYLQ